MDFYELVSQIYSFIQEKDRKFVNLISLALSHVRIFKVNIQHVKIFQHGTF